MKLVVGLGNPGRKYEGTRHNIGFECVEAVARRAGLSGQPGQGRFDADCRDVRIEGQRVLLVRPLTYMNLSGQSVRRFVDFFRIPLPDLLVICDDLALPVGALRMRAGGSSGGQKGLQNICDLLGSTDIPRLRIGIGACPPEWDAADYVLARIPAAERLVLDDAVARAADAVICWTREGINEAMSRFNRVPSRPSGPDNQTAQT